jgi:predicted nucleic acid-binding protein
MIVLDASAAAELILETETGARVADRLRDERIHVPAHFDVEVVGVVRQAVRRSVLTERDGLVAFAEFRLLPVRRWAATPFLVRAYALRATHSVADGVYVALAEALAVPLVTCDAKLGRSHGHSAVIEVL